MIKRSWSLASVAGLDVGLLPDAICRRVVSRPVAFCQPAFAALDEPHCRWPTSPIAVRARKAAVASSRSVSRSQGSLACRNRMKEVAFQPLASPCQFTSAEDAASHAISSARGHSSLIAGAALLGSFLLLFKGSPFSQKSKEVARCDGNPSSASSRDKTEDDTDTDSSPSDDCRDETDAAEYFVEKNVDQTFQVFTGTSNPELAREVCSHLGMTFRVGTFAVGRFSGDMQG